MATCNCIGPIGDCPCIRRQRQETEKALLDAFHYGVEFINVTHQELKDFFGTPDGIDDNFLADLVEKE